MTDVILSALKEGELSKRNISFTRIREIAGKDYGIRHELDWGKAVPKSEKHLAQYLYSYGLIVQSQWKKVLDEMTFSNGSVQLIDYGCGQGLASILLHDEVFSDSEPSRITHVNLIEPSECALIRAKALLTCCYQNAKITPINKFLDKVEKNDLSLSASAVKIHLFSNILDIDSFDQFDLLNKTLSTSGQHILLAVSHDREHNGGARFKDTYERLLHDDYKITFKNIFQFQCRKPAIAFRINLEI